MGHEDIHVTIMEVLNGFVRVQRRYVDRPIDIDEVLRLLMDEIRLQKERARIIRELLRSRSGEDVGISIEELERRLREYGMDGEHLKSDVRAYLLPGWWSNDKASVQAREGWLTVGWRAYPEVRDGEVIRVVFRRPLTEELGG